MRHSGAQNPLETNRCNTIKLIVFQLKRVMFTPEAFNNKESDVKHYFRDVTLCVPHTVLYTARHINVYVCDCGHGSRSSPVRLVSCPAPHGRHNRIYY